MKPERDTASMGTFVGVDWASNGWLAVVNDDEDWTAAMHPSIHSVWVTHRKADSILVDIPIGLPETERRACDREAKQFVGPNRASSVFWTPCRQAVEADSYETAKQANKDCRGDSLSSQTWGLIPRIQEVDRFVRDHTEAQETMLESHPEVCFAAFAPDQTFPSKHDEMGVAKRLDALETVGESLPEIYDTLVRTYIEERPAWARRIGQSNRDDLLDAMALTLTATLGADGFETLPDNPSTDSESLPMQIVYAEPFP